MPEHKEDLTKEDVNVAIVSYKDLPASIGAPETLAISIGKDVYEVADWCIDNRYRPVNALAVNGQLLSPGAGYFLAPGGNDWETKVRECIAYKKYPASIS